MKKILGIFLITAVLLSASVSAVFAVGDPSSGVSLKYRSETVFRGTRIRNRLTGATGKVKWSSSDKRIATVSKKGLIKAKSFGKCVISAKYKGKTYKCRIKVVRRLPDYDAKIVDVDINKSGTPFVKVKFRNYGSKTLTVLQKGEYGDMTSVTYKVKTNSAKGIKIKPRKSKTVTFYSYGKYNIYNTAGRKEPDIFAFLEANIDYSIRYDEKKYSAYTYWSEEEIEIDDEDGEVYRTELVYQHTSDIDIAKKTVPTAKSKRLK